MPTIKGSRLALRHPHLRRLAGSRAGRIRLVPCFAMALVLALLLSACSSSSSEVTPDPAVLAGQTPARTLVIDGLLPPQSGAEFEVIGGMGGSRSRGERPGRLKPVRVELVVPLRIDGVRADFEFGPTVTDTSKVLTNSGGEVPRLQQDKFLDSHEGPWRAVIRRLASGKLELVELQESTAPRGTPAPTTAAGAATIPSYRSFTARGGLPFDDDGALELFGLSLSSESGPEDLLLAFDLTVPAVVDGAKVGVNFCLDVNDQTQVFDRFGRELARTQEDGFADDNLRFRATVRRGDDNGLVVVEVRPATVR